MAKPSTGGMLLKECVDRCSILGVPLEPRQEIEIQKIIDQYGIALHQVITNYFGSQQNAIESPLEDALANQPIDYGALEKACEQLGYTKEEFKQRGIYTHLTRVLKGYYDTDAPTDSNALALYKKTVEIINRSRSKGIKDKNAMTYWGAAKKYEHTKADRKPLYYGPEYFKILEAYLFLRNLIEEKDIIVAKLQK